MTAPTPLSNAGVRFPPPLLFVIGILVGWMLDRYWYPLPLSRLGGSAVKPLGWILLALGVIVAAWGMATFRRAKTAIRPDRSTSQLVIHTVISREEKYLNDAFGADYGAYTARVRRWL